MGDSRGGKSWLLFLFFAVTGVNLCWFAVGETLSAEAPLRIVIGALPIFLVPGLILGELLRLRARHLWETVAIGFSLTLLIELVLLPIPFLLHATIAWWIASLLGVTLLGVGLLALPGNRQRPWHFLAPLMRWPGRGALGWSIVLIPVALAAWAYGAGEDLLDVCGEKMLHVMFVRYYHDMPLVLDRLGVRPGVAPPNLVNLWEFLLAGWARMIHVDPLLVFFRARFVIPVLGLAGLYLLVQMIFVRRRKVDALFFGATLMCLAGFLFVSPALRWVHGGDPTRGIFAFYGTVHHADPAADILVPLTCGLMLRLVRRPAFANAALMIALMTASFLWHPREFLQLALYLGVLGVAILWTPALRRWRTIRNWAVAVALLIGLAGVLLVASTKLVGGQSHAYDEMKIKKLALEYAALPENLAGVRNFFHVPYTFMISTITERENVLSWQELNQNSIEPSWLLDPWLIFSGIGLIALGIFGRREERGLAAYYFWLWLLALAWNCSMLVIFALTYSEFFMVTPRLLYLFAYLIIADVVLMLPRAVPSFAPRAGVPFAALAVGIGAWAWQHYGSPGAKRLSPVLTALMWLAALWVLLDRRQKTALKAGPAAIGLGGIALLFFAPFLAERAYHVVGDKPVLSRSQPKWFDDDNPFGMSAELIAWTRTLPPRQMFLVHPDGQDCIHAYAPHYEAIFPVTILLLDFPTRHAVATGQHPVLARRDSAGLAIQHAQAQAWLKARGIDYLLLNHEDYDNGLRAYVDAHPQHFEVVFHNAGKRELVVRYSPGP